MKNSQVDMKIKAEKPIQYMRGYCEFYKLKFFLTPDSLIPRPETELLVDEILKLKPDTLLDLGTGSGNIAIAVAKNLPKIRILATDISEEALKVARNNSLFHKTNDRIIFEIRDMLEGMQKAPDIIVTNLPYIPTARLLYIDPMVTEWEPRVALDGGIDGFELYRKLFAQMSKLFASQNAQKKSCLPAGKVYPKYLIGEIDYSHADFVLEESRRFFPNAQVEVKHDLAKKQRYFIISF